MFLRKYKAQRWTKRIIKKNNETKNVVDCKKLIHKTDKATLEALKKIPLFDTVCGKILSLINEPQRNILDMSSKIKITKKQIPRVYNMVESICKKIGIEMPNLYLELNREPNACTYGTKSFTITINSGLLECLEDDELYAVLAHECGHIACQHVLYHTMGALILNGGSKGLKRIESVLNAGIVGSIISATVESSLELAFFHWNRCSELSADRIAVICCGGADPVIETMMRLAGGTTHIDSEINRDLFIAQAEEYKKLTEENKMDKALEYWLTCEYSHPLLAVRAYEAQQFADSEEFKRIVV